MTVQQAFAILKEVTDKYLGTRADHGMIDLALATLAGLIPSEPDKGE